MPVPEPSAGPRSAARPRQGRKELEGAGVWARRRTRAESLLAEGEPARLDSLDSVARRGQRRREGLSAVVDQAKSFLLPAQSLFDCLYRCTFLSGSRTEENAIPTSISLHASACLCAFGCLRLDRGRRVLHPETESVRTRRTLTAARSARSTRRPTTNGTVNCSLAIPDSAGSTQKAQTDTYRRAVFRAVRRVRPRRAPRRVGGPSPAGY